MCNLPCDRNNAGITEHSQRVEYVEQRLGDEGTELLRLLSRHLPNQAEEIHWQGWRQQLLFATLEALPLSSDSSEGKKAVDKVKNMKTWYMQREPLIPLQLAVWKSQCLQDVPQVPECYLSWVTSGWKVNKAKQWDSNASAMVASLVQPFLFDAQSL
jgi:hypothetical protein